MKATSLLIDAYMHAAKKYDASEKMLSRALDCLNAQKATGNAITSEFRNAQLRYRECNAIWDTVEHARRAYWLHVAKQAEQELERLALPLLATINHAHSAGRSGMSAPGIHITATLACKDLPAVNVSDAPVPIAGIDTDAIDRAEEEWVL